jgi:phosphatidylglycerophosphatase C
MEIVVAVFDVDHTLTVRDCVLPFMRRVAGSAGLARAVFVRPWETFRMVASKNRDGLKQKFVNEVFSGKSVADTEEAGIAFAEMVVHSWIRGDVAARLRWHQNEGHVVLLVSASLSPYLEPLGDLLEVDAVLCTELETSGDTYTGLLLGSNCRGAEKVNRISQWCAESGVPLSAIQFAYGDSSGDTDMIELAENGTWVNDVEISSWVAS